jgi:accessory colonization factor AcfC
MLGKSRMFSEGIKPVPYTIFWNKKKNTVAVQAGPKDTWYEILINQVDTVHGHVTHIGFLADLDKNASEEEKEKAKCEVRFQFDKVSIKKGPARLEEFLLEGASVWEDRTVVAE